MTDALQVLDCGGLEAICIQNIVLWFPEHLLRNPLSLLAKLENPQQIYAFGGIRFPHPDSPNHQFDYLHQAQELISLGFDGIKLFGKPNMRQAFGEPFDSPIFSPMFDWLAQEKIPVLFHVGDPREFWSVETAPDFARENSWIYDNPPFDAYYDEIERLLTNHPGLNVLFPHFFFLSDELERLRTFLNRWESIWIDITPGSEMYHNFTQSHSEARKFFLEYQDRILFGTDNTGDAQGDLPTCVPRSLDRLNTMLNFLSDSSANGWGEVFRGLELPENVIDKILYKNFYRFINSSTPRFVDPKQALCFAQEMQCLAANTKNPVLDREFERVIEAYKSRTNSV